MNPNYNAEELYRLIFDSSTEGLIIANNQGVIEMANEQACVLFGYEMNELEGLMVNDLLPKRFREGHSKHMKGFMKKPKKRKMGSNMNLEACKKDGTLFPVEISLNYGNIGGERKAIAMVSDISERVKASNQLTKLKEDLERQVEERTKELKIANDEAKIALIKERELNALKSRFVSMASHEFRTPLSTILSSTTLAERYSSPEQIEKRDKHYKRIKSSVHNLTAILNDFLSLDKIQEGKISITPTEFLLSELIDECVDEMQTYFKEKQTVIQTIKPENTKVFLDRNIVKNCLINLLSNASKYSDVDARIEVVVDNTILGFSVLIKDEGMGIPKSEQKHLFERFFRATNAFNLQGTGLGLNIVKKYVELLGGTITFESEEGIGTTFTIDLPKPIEN